MTLATLNVNTDTDVLVIYTDTLVLAASAGNTVASVNYWIEVDGVTLAGAVSQILLQADPSVVPGISAAMALHGFTIGLAPGVHAITVQAIAATGTDAHIGGGTLTAWQWAP